MKTLRIPIILVSIALTMVVTLAILTISETTQASTLTYDPSTKLHPKSVIRKGNRHNPISLGNLAYVALSNSDTVALINTTTNTMIGGIDVGSSGCDFPWRPTISPDGHYVYISCRSSGNIVVIETSGNSVATVFSGIPSPGGIAFRGDGAYALVGSIGNNQIAIVDTATYQINFLSTLGAPRSIAVHPHLNLAYAACTDGTILVIDTSTFSILKTIPVGTFPWDVAVSPDGQWGFSTSRSGAGLTVINALDYSLYTTITGLGELNGLDITPDGSEIYVSGILDKIHVIDGHTFSLVTTITNPGNNWEIASNCDGSAIYASVPKDDRVSAIDTDSYTITQQIIMPEGGGPRGIAICPQFVTPAVLVNPPEQTKPGARGQVVEHEGLLLNATGATDSFTLTLGSHIWETTLSTDSLGPIADGEWLTFTVQVTVPVNTDWYLTETVRLNATSVSSPNVYSDTASFTTQAYAPPEISISPESLSSSLLTNETVTKTLTISNGNGVPLNFDISSNSGAPWLSTHPISGTVPTASSFSITVTLHATDLQPATYPAKLVIQSNDPISLSVDIPVTMTVQPDANIGWVEGYVIDASTGNPLEATIIALGQPYTITTEPDTGFYKLWLEAGEYTLQVSAAGYDTATRKVNISVQTGISENFSLIFKVIEQKVYLPLITR